MNILSLIPFLWLLTSHVPKAQPCHCDHYIKVEENYVDGQKLKVQPGDTVCIKAGKKKYLNLFNFFGTATAPIVFINNGGQVEIGDPQWHYGCVIGKSHHFVFTGTGDPAHEYGFKISYTKEGASGLAIGASHFDINHVEVSHTGFAGIMAKIDPNCDTNSWQENFTMEEVSFHHNYIHDTGGEGFYIGYTGGARSLHCEGKEVMVEPHNIEHIKVFQNRVENTGWDGIQVSRAVKNCEIHHNQILNYGTKNEKWQKAGIVIGGGTTGQVYNNYIHTGTGGGIHVFGAGENLMYNNVIIQAGEDGIYCRSLESYEGAKFGYVMINNTIVNPKRFGLMIQHFPTSSNRFYNNVVIQPDKLFVSVPAPATSWESSDNYFHTDTTIKNTSLTDRGKHVAGWGIRMDYSDNPRPAGGGYDIGAYEFTTPKVSETFPH